MHNSVGDLIHCAAEKLGQVADRAGEMTDGAVSVERESAEILSKLLLRGWVGTESTTNSSAGVSVLDERLR